MEFFYLLTGYSAFLLLATTLALIIGALIERSGRLSVREFFIATTAIALRQAATSMGS